MKLESGRGQHIHSTEPSFRRALYEQFPMIASPWIMSKAVPKQPGRRLRQPHTRDARESPESGCFAAASFGEDGLREDDWQATADTTGSSSRATAYRSGS